METLPVFLGGIFAVLLLTSFVKMFTTLNILRYGLGLEGAGMGFVILGLSFALSLVVSAPQINSGGGMEGVFSGKLSLDKTALESNFRPFMEANIDPDIREKITSLHTKLREKDGTRIENGDQDMNSKTPFGVTISVFLLSELKRSFLLGLLFILPFVALDLIVANALMALGVVKMSPSVVSLPLKLMLFVSVDGWTLIAEKLLASYLPI